MYFASAILPVSGSLRSSLDLTLSIRKSLGHSFVRAPLQAPLIHPPYQNCLSPRETAFNKLIFYDVDSLCCRLRWCLPSLLPSRLLPSLKNPALSKYLHEVSLQYHNRLFCFSDPPLHSPSSFQERPHALKWSPSPQTFMAVCESLY